MKINIEGAWIELTYQQLKQINAVKAEREQRLKTFEETLISFGFKKCGIRMTGIQCFSNDLKDWYAEVIPYENPGASYVWMTGSGLKDAHGFPGGYFYDEPENLIEELSKQ